MTSFADLTPFEEEEKGAEEEDGKEERLKEAIVGYQPRNGIGYSGMHNHLW